MSLNGSVERRMTFCDVSFTRHLSEQEMKLTPGWHLRLTLGPAEVTIEDLGWRRWRWNTGPGAMLWACGFCLSVDSSGESCERRYHGDATALEETT